MEKDIHSPAYVLNSPVDSAHASNVSTTIKFNDPIYDDLLLCLIVLNLTNVAMHSLGIHLLLSTYKSSSHKTQHFYVINLSIAECSINILDMVRNFPQLIELTTEVEGVVNDIRQYMLIFSYTGVSVAYYAIMVYIAVDKLMEIVLNISYPVYWDERKARYLMLVTWGVALFISLSVGMLHTFACYHWQRGFFTYFLPIVDFGYVILAAVTYGYIFKKFKQSKRIPPICLLKGSNMKAKESSFSIFRRSRFFVSALLIVSFLVLMIAPDLAYLFVCILSGKPSRYLQIACWISYACSNIVDVSILIFLQDNVRKTFLKRFPKLNGLWSRGDPKQYCLATMRVYKTDLKESNV